VTVAADVMPGVTLPPYRLRVSTVRLFRFSAVTWNAHRIHYDVAYARSEGYPDVLVQSHLHGCVLLNAVLAWAGPDASLRAFGWQNRGIAVAGDELVVTGEIVAVREAPGECIVELRLEEHDQRGELCAPGHATVAWPAGP
jgi:hydroxyacyl-ACP dehydratase HTD2-like protein with hotdog domain